MSANPTDFGKPFEVTSDGHLIVTCDNDGEVYSPIKFVGDKKVAKATGTDEAHGYAVEHFKAGKKFAIKTFFKGEIMRGKADASLSVPLNIKPTGNIVDGFPEFEDALADTTQFKLVSGATQAGGDILYGVL